jgi:hypothetical protein
VYFAQLPPKLEKTYENIFVVFIGMMIFYTFVVKACVMCTFVMIIYSLINLTATDSLHCHIVISRAPEWPSRAPG